MTDYNLSRLIGHLSSFSKEDLERLRGAVEHEFNARWKAAVEAQELEDRERFFFSLRRVPLRIDGVINPEARPCNTRTLIGIASKRSKGKIVHRASFRIRKAFNSDERILTVDAMRSCMRSFLTVDPKAPWVLSSKNMRNRHRITVGESVNCSNCLESWAHGWHVPDHLLNRAMKEKA